MSNTGMSAPPSQTLTPTAAPTIRVKASHEIVGIGSLLFVLIILITLFSGKLIKIFNFHHINECTISIVFGLMIGMIITFFPESSTELFSFHSEFFFYVLLPPIVFEAGFELKRKHFFRNMTTILMYAVLGTVISTLIIAFGLFSLSFLNILPLFNSGNSLECLLFGALLSAVDPVGTLSVLGNPMLNVDPTLYSLIFGESVLNDAVSIVLYKIFSNFSESNIIISFEKHFFNVIGQFCGIFIGSFLIGVVSALCASAILRHVLHLLTMEPPNARASQNNLTHIELESMVPVSPKNTQKNNKKTSVLTVDNDAEHSQTQSHDELLDSPLMTNTKKDVIYLDEYRHHESSILGESPSLEFSIIILFAYLSYNLGEVLSLSGIVSVFSCGICMSHYAWYNLTWIAQISLHHIIVAISKCCENFVYAYLGISTVLSLAPSTAKYGWNLSLIIFSILLCILSRAANIFPLSALSNSKRKIKISFNMQIMLFFSGLRGAIAFALALNINTPHSDLIVTTTLSVVIITTVVCGCTTKYMLGQLGLDNTPKIEDIATTEDANRDNPCNDAHYYKLNPSEHNKKLRIMTDELEHESNAVKADNVLERESPTTSFTYNREGINHFINRKYYGIHKYWHSFDTQYMQYLFGGSSNPFIQHSNIGIYSNRAQAIRRASHIIRTHRHSIESGTG